MHTGPEKYTRRHVGELYVAGRDVAEVAKLIRKDLRDAGYKASVRIQRYAGGCNITARIKGLSDDLIEAMAFGVDASEFLVHGNWRYVVETAVREIMTAYQRGESNSMTDYYSYSFYDHAVCEVTEPETFRAIVKDRAEVAEAEIMADMAKNGTTLPPLPGVAAADQPYGLARIVAEEQAEPSAHAGFLATLGIES